MCLEWHAIAVPPLLVEPTLYLDIYTCIYNHVYVYMCICVYVYICVYVSRVACNSSTTKNS